MPVWVDSPVLCPQAVGITGNISQEWEKHTSLHSFSLAKPPDPFHKTRSHLSWSGCRLVDTKGNVKPWSSLHRTLQCAAVSHPPSAPPGNSCGSQPSTLAKALCRQRRNFLETVHCKAWGQRCSQAPSIQRLLTTAVAPQREKRTLVFQDCRSWDKELSLPYWEPTSSALSWARTLIWKINLRGETNLKEKADREPLEDSLWLCQVRQFKLLRLCSLRNTHRIALHWNEANSALHSRAVPWAEHTFVRSQQNHESKVHEFQGFGHWITFYFTTSKSSHLAE